MSGIPLEGYLHPAVFVWTFATPYWQFWASWSLWRWLRAHPRREEVIGQWEHQHEGSVAA